MATGIAIEEGLWDEGQLIEAWGEAFSQPPYNYEKDTVQDFRKRLARHAEYDGFHCCVAVEGGRVLGFAYGYTDRPGQWWHEQVASKIMGSLSKSEAQSWLDGAFALTELAVVPAAQGRGVGGRLHDALLLEDLPHERALLSVRREASSAMALYRRRGWKVLVPEFRFASGDEPYDVMGLKLGAAAS